MIDVTDSPKGEWHQSGRWLQVLRGLNIDNAAGEIKERATP
jgi:hypothetical protein